MSTVNTYTLRIARIAGSYDETPLVMIDATVTHDTGRFFEGAMHYHATAQKGAIKVNSFMAFLSPNGKELHAFFTTDAFAAFLPGLFDLDIGYGGQVIATFENRDISTELIPLAPFYAALGLPDADNAWLATL